MCHVKDKRCEPALMLTKIVSVDVYVRDEEMRRRTFKEMASGVAIVARIGTAMQPMPR